MNRGFRSRLQAGDIVYGPIVSLPSPAVAEILAGVGFDWLFIDGEHGPFATGEIAESIRAAGELPCIVRVPGADAVSIQNVLDVGATGIIVPQVNSVEQAELAVRFAKYPPEGTRGVGLARAHGYGLKFDDYMQRANSDVVVIVQAEHIDGVNNIESIVRVPGIDAVLIGPYDLSASLGKTGQVNDPAVTDAIQKVADTCQDAGIPLGIFGVTVAALRPYIAKGFTLIATGCDTLFLGQAAGKFLAEVSAE